MKGVDSIPKLGTKGDGGFALLERDCEPLAMAHFFNLICYYNVK